MNKRILLGAAVATLGVMGGCGTLIGIDSVPDPDLTTGGTAGTSASAKPDAGGKIETTDGGGTGNSGGAPSSGGRPADTVGEAGAIEASCPGECSAGAVDHEACGNCGTHSRNCSAACKWSDFGACEGEGVCTPNASDTAACGNCGSMIRTCTAACAWSAFGACGQGVCTPGATSTQACGNCGKESRSCDATCNWGPYGACTGQGACAPNATQSQACGACGTQSETCTAACAWPGFGACSGQGTCTPGAVSTQACGSCGGTQTRTCSASCAWGGFGGCSISTPSNFGASCNCGDGTIQCDGSCNASCPTISVITAREGCLDIQPAGNMTAVVASACNGKTSCSFEALTDSQIPQPHSTRSFCTQGMEITYGCTYRGGSKFVSVPGDAWNNPPAQLSCP